MHWCCICLWAVHKHWGWWEWEKRPNHLFTHSRITHSASTFCTNFPADTFSEKTMYVLHTAVSIQRIHPQSNTKNTSYCPVSIVMVLACVIMLAQYFGGRVNSYPGSQIIMFKQYGCERTMFKKQKAIIPSHNMILNTTFKAQIFQLFLSRTYVCRLVPINSDFSGPAHCGYRSIKHKEEEEEEGGS